MNFDDFDLDERARKLSHREPFHQGGVPLPRNLIRYTAPDDLDVLAAPVFGKLSRPGTRLSGCLINFTDNDASRCHLRFGSHCKSWKYFFDNRGRSPHRRRRKVFLRALDV